MESTAMALEFYRQAKSEALERIKMRDQTLLTYVGAVGAVVGFVVQQAHRDPTFLLIIPVLCVGATFIIVQHHVYIHALSRHINDELMPFVASQGIELPESWATFKRRTQSGKDAETLRRWGFSLILLVPVGTALVYNHEMPLLGTDSEVLFFVLSFVAFLASLLLLQRKFLSYRTKTDPKVSAENVPLPSAVNNGQIGAQMEPKCKLVSSTSDSTQPVGIGPSS